MRGVVKLILVATLAADGDLETIGSGKKRLRVRTVANVPTKKGDKWEDIPVWIDLAFWGDRAEKLAKVMKKGTNIYVEGDVRNNNYEKDGVKHYGFQFMPNPNSLVLLPGKMVKSTPEDSEAPDEGGSLEEMANNSPVGDDDLPI